MLNGTPAQLLRNKLASLQSQQPLCILGAAVIDVVVSTPRLPSSGDDIAVEEKGIHVGGCALNVAIALKRLGIDSVNALPLGNGRWADLVRSDLASRGISTALPVDPTMDNGWCMALVEPCGERTFISVTGVEDNWSQQTLASLGQLIGYIYVSGYQLAGRSGELLLTWLEQQTDATVMVDFGPRLLDISDAYMTRLMALNPIVTVNRDEATALGMDGSVAAFALSWVEKHGGQLIVRLDKDGAYVLCRDNNGNLWGEIVEPFDATVVDTIGAGDSHAGATLAGLASGWSLAESALLGNAVASYVVSQQGGDCAPCSDTLSDYLSRY
ncbi:PfkB family carbohydrate kinase [Ferrimonas senticii]|uniref:PfkB family carbohydrate kinase n=1 Tax=Ferrimonas senticii TaxID=394566 RepID=UPI00041F2F95|nr:PfkB family carbohydrate kinase [Ferrimonas senticii]